LLTINYPEYLARISLIVRLIPLNLKSFMAKLGERVVVGTAAMVGDRTRKMLMPRTKDFALDKKVLYHKRRGLYEELN
jgi:hypothetical protein